MTHPPEDRLQDYTEDLLCREERAELEAHLVRCPECTAMVRAERELRAALRQLPRSIEPPAHVLAAVHAAIAADAPATAPAQRWSERSIGSLRYPLAAAALVLVAITAVVSTRWQGTAPERVTAVADDAGVVRQVLATEPRYVSAAAELEAALAAHPDALPPATRALVEENLRIIDRALAESRAALRQEPGNAALAELLRSTHEQKLTLLRRATRATGGT